MKTILMITCAAVALSGCVAGTQTVPALPGAPIEVTPLPSPPIEAPEQPEAPVGDQTDQETPEEEDSLVWDLILGTGFQADPTIRAYYDFENKGKGSYGLDTSSLSNTVNMTGYWSTDRKAHGRLQRVGEVDVAVNFGSNTITGEISNIFETVWDHTCVSRPSACRATVVRNYDGALTINGTLTTRTWSPGTRNGVPYNITRQEPNLFITTGTLTDSNDATHRTKFKPVGAISASFRTPGYTPANPRLGLINTGTVEITVNGVGQGTQHYEIEATNF